jgi:hypothetical protein
MTATQAKLVYYGAIGLLLWWLRKPAPAAASAPRVVREIEIDANIGSGTFGDEWPPASQTASPEVVAAIEASRARIEAFDAAHPENETILRGLGP